MVEKGIIRKLVRSIKPSLEASNLIELLEELSRSLHGTAAKKDFLKEDGFHVMRDITDTWEDEVKVVQKVFRVLWMAIENSKANLEKFSSLGGLEQCLSFLMKYGDKAEVAEDLYVTLTYIIRDEENMQRFHESRGVEMCLRLVPFWNSQQGRMNRFKLIEYLFSVLATSLQYEENQKQFREVGGVRVTLEAMSVFAGKNSLISDVLATLWAVTTRSDIVREIVSMDGVETLVRSIEMYKKDTSLLERIMGSLWNILCDEESGRVRFYTCSGTNITMGLLKQNLRNQSLLFYLFGMFSNATKTSSIVDSYRSIGLIQYSVEVLKKFPRNEDVVYQVALTLVNLLGNSFAKGVLSAAGGVEQLQVIAKNFSKDREMCEAINNIFEKVDEALKIPLPDPKKKTTPETKKGSGKKKRRREEEDGDSEGYEDFDSSFDEEDKDFTERPKKRRRTEKRIGRPPKNAVESDTSAVSNSAAESPNKEDVKKTAGKQSKRKHTNDFEGVKSLLHELGLAEFISLFEKQDISSLVAFAALDDTYLKEMGVKKIGPRAILTKAATKLRRDYSEIY